MSLEADYLVDRRRLRRRVTFWRIVAVALALVGVLIAGFLTLGKRGIDRKQPHIARVSISGIITGDASTLKLLRQVGDAAGPKAVLLSIESPGGTVSGSEELYEGIRKLSAKKPVVAVVSGLAASGAYIAALGTDHLVARGNAVVGSIGVIAQLPNASKLLDKVGVTMETVRSSPLKASPSGLEPTPPEALKALEDTVMDDFAWFKGLVQERRQYDDAGIAKVADGRVFTGRQALALKLIDELGGETEAVAWLHGTKNIDDKYKILDWKRPSESSRFGFLRSMSLAAALLGFDRVSESLGEADQLLDEQRLTGILALWSPPPIQ
jgi:protease-4